MSEERREGAAVVGQCSPVGVKPTLWRRCNNPSFIWSTPECRLKPKWRMHKEPQLCTGKWLLFLLRISSNLVFSYTVTRDLFWPPSQTRVRPYPRVSIDQQASFLLSPHGLSVGAYTSNIFCFKRTCILYSWGHC